MTTKEYRDTNTIQTSDANVKSNITSFVMADGYSIHAKDYTDLINSSEIIVTGQFTGKGEIVNTARDADDPSKPAPSVIGIDQIYYFKVEQYLKGSGVSSLSIVNAEGLQDVRDGKVLETIEQAKENFPHWTPKFDTKYLAFLNPVVAEPPGKYYGGSVPPCFFRISENNYAWPIFESVGSDDGGRGLFPVLSMDEMIEQINHPEILVTPKIPNGGYPLPADQPESAQPLELTPDAYPADYLNSTSP
jgi:hypothetical protein